MNSDKINIKDLAVDDRPREKMLLKGASVLSDAELIAILLGSGNKEESAIDLSQRLLKSMGNNLHNLGRITLKELTKFKGIGDAKAITVLAALELGRRRKLFEPQAISSVTCSKDAYHQLSPILADLSYEEFWVILLTRSNKIITQKRISEGGTSSTVIDVRKILKIAIENNATGIVLSHNHPSGNLKPSQPDIDITNKLKAGAKIFDMDIVDHIIVTQSSYFSFADEGLM